MPVSCSPSEIAADATCFTCQSEKKLAGMIVYLLGQILLAEDPMADISPQAIANASSCYTACLSGKGLLGAQVYLLCQIAGSGGIGGGVRQWFNGNGAPSGFQTGQTPGVPSWYQDLDTGIIWADSTGIGTWSGPN